MLEFQPARPEMAPVASALIYLTMHKMADHLFGAARANGMLHGLFQASRNRFSYQFADVVNHAGAVAGLVISYPGPVMKALEVPMAFRLIQVGGLARFSRFIWKARPLVQIREAELDEYFISNVAVRPELQGQGLGQSLLRQIEMRARQQGFGKLSLTVDIDNPRACSLYQRLGFAVRETVRVEPLQRSIGYAGFHRMVKLLV